MGFLQPFHVNNRLSGGFFIPKITPFLCTRGNGSMLNGVLRRIRAVVEFWWRGNGLVKAKMGLIPKLSGPAGPLLFLGPDMTHTIQLPTEPWFAYLMVFLFTALGTLSRIYFNRTTNQQKDIDATVGQIVFSIFAAALFFMVAVRLGWLVYGLSVGCGLAAWKGIEMITYLGKRLIEKFEGDKDDKKSG